MLTDKVVFSEIRTDSKYFNDFKMNNILWAQDIEGTLDGKHEAVASKPSGTVLDLGKSLLQGVKEGDVAKVLELMGRGAPFTTDWLGTTALHVAATNNSYEICKILLKGGINKDAKTKVDRTPLHFAVFEGHESIVELLLSHNCDVDVKDMLKMTALHWAIEKKFKNIARLLLKHGADPSVASKFGKTPESIAIETGQSYLLHDLELARQMRQQSLEQAQKATESLIYEMQQSQIEANEAANNIEFDPEPNPDFDLSSTIAAKSVNSIEDIVVESESNDIAMANNVPNINSPSSNIIDSNSESNMEDEDMNYVEPIVQLQNLDEPKHMHTLRLLKNHGISMLPEEDTANNLLTSALQDGRKLVLSEAGKKCLNETKFSRPSPNIISQSTLQTQKQSSENNLQQIKGIKKQPILVRTKSANIKQNKNIKVITMDMFKQMYAGNFLSSIKPISTNLAKSTDNNIMNVRHPQTIAKITKISGVRKTPQIVKTLHLQGSQNIGPKSYSRIQPVENDELPPNIIEVCSDTDIDDETEYNNDSVNCVTSSSIGSISNSHNFNTSNNRIYPNKNPILSRTSSSTSLSSNTNNIVTAPSIPLLDIPEICRQLFELRKQTEDLQKQLELSKKQNEEYKIRLDRLEREDLERLSRETYS